MRTVVALLAAMTVGSTQDTGLQSSGLAKKLSAVLVERHLDAVAAQDPNESDRFIAALLYPNVQLLVVSARYASPSSLQARLQHKQYRDVYLDLQAAAISDSNVFVQDMRADGLCVNPDQAADLVYEGRKPARLFDADWKKQKLSEDDYKVQLTAADAQYSRMLEVLLTAVDATLTAESR